MQRIVRQILITLLCAFSSHSYAAKSITPMEGRSLVGAFANQPIARDALFWEHEGNAAVRVGHTKLVRNGRNAAWELYDLKADRTELHDLAATQPDKAKELAAKWDAWAIRVQVKPYPGEADGSAPKKGKGKGKNKVEAAQQ